MTFRVKRSRSNSENFEVEYIDNGIRDRERVSIEVKYEIIYGFLNGIETFDPG